MYMSTTTTTILNLPSLSGLSWLRYRTMDKEVKHLFCTCTRTKIAGGED